MESSSISVVGAKRMAVFCKTDGTKAGESDRTALLRTEYSASWVMFAGGLEAK